MSVVICTYNRCRDLPAALDSVLAQTDAPPYELIVVDNGSTDRTAEVVAERLSYHTNLRYILEPERGLPHARNTGIRKARGRVIAFTDDDVVAAPDWVRAISAAFGRFPEADCIGGRVLPRWPAGGVPSWLSQLQPLALQDKGDVPMIVNRDNAAPCLIGANFAFSRSAFAKAGLFSPDYPRTQDREFQLRLWRSGGLGVYVPDIVTYVDVPEERLTKAYYRLWFGRAGRFHSRMGLLDSLDAHGRMVERRDSALLLGVPLFLYRGLGAASARGIAGWVRRDERSAFRHETQLRYLGAYIAERWRRHRLTVSGLARDIVSIARRAVRGRPRTPAADVAGNVSAAVPAAHADLQEQQQ